MKLPNMEPIYIAFGVFLIFTAYNYLKPQGSRHYISLNTKDAKKMLESPNILLIDVRKKDEYDKGYIKDAKNIPLDQLEKRLIKIPRDKDIIIYCQTGGRSIRAIHKLEIAGFTRLYHMHQGFRGWNNLGYPFKKKRESK